MGKLQGKIALITGGTSGIGLATAKRFVEEGAIVYIVGRRQDELTKAVAAVGKSIIGIRADVSVLGDLDRVFEQVKLDRGHLDVLFANAGIAKLASIQDIAEEFYDSIFDINVKGVLFTVQKALPLLKDGSAIVLTSSIVGSKGFPSNSVYSASKAAVRSFARTLTSDLKPRRIRVNAVSPGSIDTIGFQEMINATASGQQRLQNIKNVVPAGRLGEPDEVAKMVLFLASDDSSFMTGAEVFVDGGAAQV